MNEQSSRAAELAVPPITSWNQAMTDKHDGSDLRALDNDPKAITSMFARIVARQASAADYTLYMSQWDRRTAIHRAARRRAA